MLTFSELIMWQKMSSEPSKGPSTSFRITIHLASPLWPELVHIWDTTRIPFLPSPPTVHCPHRSQLKSFQRLLPDSEEKPIFSSNNLPQSMPASKFGPSFPLYLECSSLTATRLTLQLPLSDAKMSFCHRPFQPPSLKANSPSCFSLPTVSLNT